MTSGEILQSVGYLLWAAGFLALVICLGIATIGYRRFARRENRQ